MKKIKKNWIINNLNNNTAFSDAALIIIDKKLCDLIIKIKDYLNEGSVENLHDLRISVRRLRYTLENFYDCFAPKRFIKFYNILEDLQDTLGEARDLDVLLQKFLFYDVEITSKLNKDVMDSRFSLNENINKSLNLFLNSKVVDKFIIKKKVIK